MACWRRDVLSHLKLNYALNIINNFVDVHVFQIKILALAQAVNKAGHMSVNNLKLSYDPCRAFLLEIICRTSKPKQSKR